MDMAFEHAAGLTESEYSDVVHAMQGVAGGWSVERDRDDRGITSLAILSVNEDGMSFLVWREANRLELGCALGDFYAGLGAHVCIDAVIRAVVATVESAAAARRQVSLLGLAAPGVRR